MPILSIVDKERIFVIAKTYPTRSSKYKELMCTAGINENGEWIRIYPIPFRTLDSYQQFQRYTWIEAEIVKDQSDPRPESHKINASTIDILEHIPPEKQWIKRRDIVLNTPIYTSLKTILELQKNNTISLCTFKPSKFLDIIAVSNPVEELNEEEKKEFINANRSLFDDHTCEVEFTGMPHIPYKFKLKFEDEEGTVSTLSILDWEILQLYLNCKSRKDSDAIAIEKVKYKIDQLIQKDLYLFLGTMRKMHGWTKNPYTIIGLFYPPKLQHYQPTLF